MVMGEEGKEEGEGGTLLGLPELDTEVDVRERGREGGRGERGEEELMN